MLSVRLPLLAFVFVAASAANAVAPQQPCTSDDECGPDEICALSDCGAPCDPDDEACEPTDCGSEGGTCIAIETPPEPTECRDSTECAAGQYCLLADCGPTCDPDDANCEPTDCSSIGRCVEEEGPIVECATDSDCDGEDICIIEQHESCSGSDPGEPGSDQAPPRDPPSECTSVTYAICAPRYLAPCAIDSDCGAGFTCEIDTQTNCACTAPDGDPNTEECVCDDAIATEGYCELIPVACNDDAGCDNGFVCIFNGDVGVGCSEAGDDGDSNCGAEAPPPDAIAEEGFCAPADFNDPRGGETGETPTVDETNEEDIVGIDGDEDGFGFHCSSTNANPAGLLPFAALALVLRRRRR